MLEDTTFLGSSLTQWLIALAWLIGAIAVGALLHWLLGRRFQPEQGNARRLGQELLGQAALVAFVVVGVRQASTVLTSSYIIDSFYAALGPVIAVGLALWFIIRVHRLFVRGNFLSKIIIDQIVPIIFLVLAFSWVGRFWVTRPLTCVPLCNGVNSTNRDLSNLTLRGVAFQNANLTGTNLSEVDLTSADLSGAQLHLVQLRNADLSDAVLIGADLNGADLRGANLRGADLRGADLSNADLTEVNLTGARLSGVRFVRTKLTQAGLSGVDLAGVILTRATLTGANMTGVDLRGANLSGADLSSVTLADGELTGALLNRAVLTGADLRGTNLSGASFIGADLTSADLTGGQLVGATLIGANLRGAELSGVDLSGSRLLSSEILLSDTLIDPFLLELNEIQVAALMRDANLRGVNFDETTVWPEGKTAFLADLLGESALLEESGVVDAADSETTDEAEVVVDPDFLVVGPSSAGRLNRWVINAMTSTVLTTTVVFNSIDRSLAFGVLCRDETVAFVSINRRISEMERRACEESEHFPTEILVASEAFVIVVQSQNGIIDAPVSPAAARALLTAERWIDVDSSWPAETIQHYLPDVESAELALLAQWVDPDGGTDLTKVPNAVYSVDSTATVRELTGDPFGIGIVDYGTYLDNSDSLRLVDVEGLDLSLDAIRSGAYPFVQPLYLYVNRSDLPNRPDVADFLAFYLEVAGEAAEATGNFPLREETLATLRATVADARTGDLLLGDSLIETSILVSEPAVTHTQTVSVSESVPTVIIPETTIVAAGDRAVAPLLLTAFSFSTVEPGELGLSVEQLPAAEALARLCRTQQLDVVMTTGETDLSALEECPAESLIAVPAALDGVALIVSPENNFAATLTVDQIATLLFAETWSEVDADWPDEPFVKLATDAALLRDLITVVAGGDVNLALSLSRAAVVQQPRVDLLAQTVADDPNAVGIVSYAALRPYLNAVQPATVAGTALTVETIGDGRYPFVRPLLLYTTIEVLEMRPIVDHFLTEYLTRVEELATLAGYAPPLPDRVTRALTRLSTITSPTMGVDSAESETGAATPETESAPPETDAPAPETDAPAPETLPDPGSGDPNGPVSGPEND